MKRGLIEQMLSGMDDKYIQEAVETQERADEGKSSVLRMRRLAAAAGAGVVIVGAGVSVGQLPPMCCGIGCGKTLWGRRLRRWS